MQKEYYLINEAAKEVQVEAHVLRYWEEELGLSIKRNKKGHRLYSRDDVSKFIKIKKLKEEGLQLKAVKKIMKEIPSESDDDNDIKVVNFHIKNEFDEIEKDKVSDIVAGRQEGKIGADKKDDSNLNSSIGKKNDVVQKSPIRIEIKDTEIIDKKNSVTHYENENKKEIKLLENLQNMSDEKREKAYRIQVLLRHMIDDSITYHQKEMVREIKDNIAKEFDYQFRQFEEQQSEIEKNRIKREEQRELEQKEREESHFKKIDELLRLTTVKGKRKKLS